MCMLLHLKTLSAPCVFVICSLRLHIVRMQVRGFKDTHPKVRAAVCEAFGEIHLQFLVWIMVLELDILFYVFSVGKRENKRARRC